MLIILQFKIKLWLQIAKVLEVNVNELVKNG